MRTPLSFNHPLPSQNFEKKPFLLILETYNPNYAGHFVAIFNSFNFSSMLSFLGNFFFIFYSIQSFLFLIQSNPWFFYSIQSFIFYSIQSFIFLFNPIFHFFIQSNLSFFYSIQSFIFLFNTIFHFFIQSNPSFFYSIQSFIFLFNTIFQSFIFFISHSTQCLIFLSIQSFKPMLHFLYNSIFTFFIQFNFFYVLIFVSYLMFNPIVYQLLIQSYYLFLKYSWSWWHFHIILHTLNCFCLYSNFGFHCLWYTTMYGTLQFCLTSFLAIQNSSNGACSEFTVT